MRDLAKHETDRNSHVRWCFENRKWMASEESDLFKITFQVNRRRRNLAKTRPGHQGKKEFRLLSNIIITKLTEAFNNTDISHLNIMANYCRSTTYFQKSFKSVGKGSLSRSISPCWISCVHSTLNNYKGRKIRLNLP